jgi:hypothetical protein
LEEIVSGAAFVIALERVVVEPGAANGFESGGKGG